MAMAAIGMAGFASVTQLIGSGITFNQSVNAEYNRQKGVCDAITSTKKQNKKIQELLAMDQQTLLRLTQDKTKLIEYLQETSEISDMVKYQQRQFVIKLSISVVISLVIIAYIYIVML